MNVRAQGVVNVGAAAVLIGGILLIAFPPYGASITQLVMMTIAAAAALSALLLAVPEWGGGRWWRSPFLTDVDVSDEGEEESRELDRLRTMFGGRRHPIRVGLHLPPDLVRVLRSLIRDALEREGTDPQDHAGRDAAGRRLSPASWAVLDHDLRLHPPWYRIRRPAPSHVAQIVHDIMDDLARLGGGAVGPLPSNDHHHPAT